jgi:hypothetical protein
MNGIVTEIRKGRANVRIGNNAHVPQFLLLGCTIAVDKEEIRGEGAANTTDPMKKKVLLLQEESEAMWVKDANLASYGHAT